MVCQLCQQKMSADIRVRHSQQIDSHDRQCQPNPLPPGFGSHIDETCVSEVLVRQISGWVVLEEGSGNDHKYNPLYCGKVDNGHCSEESWEMGS